MITTILFDLDGTLLPMDQEQFVSAYFSRLVTAMAPHGYDPDLLMQAVGAGTMAMVRNDGSARNDQVFWKTAQKVYGRDIQQDEDLFLHFYENEFQQVRQVCGFNPQASETISAIHAMGLDTILATNPLFPSVATYSRTLWAGLNPKDFRLITTYENASYCKPNPDYYREILEKQHLKAAQCLMVGNDVGEDMVAEKLGMAVFLLTDCLINRDAADISRYPQGGFPELNAYLRKLSAL